MRRTDNGHLFLMYIVFSLILFPLLFVFLRIDLSYQEVKAGRLPNPHSSEGKLSQKYILRGDISPDGSLIAVTVRDEKSEKITLYSYSKKRDKVWKVADGVGFSPVWDWDNALWFCKKEKDGTFSIYKWRSDASKPVPILKKGYVSPLPSPNGEWLSFVIYRGEASSKSSEEIARLVIYNLRKGFRREVSFKKFGRFLTPFRYQWTADSKKLYTFCLQGNPQAGFALFLLKPPAFEPQIVHSHTYPIAEQGSWCLQDGSIVFVEREEPFKLPPDKSKIPVAPPLGSGLPEFSPYPLSTFNFWRFKEGEGKKLLWKEKGYNRSFAISFDGRFLVIPHEDIDEKGGIYSFVNLVDLSTKEVKRVEREEIRKGVGRIWYHIGLGGFCLVTPQGVYLMNKEGEITPLLSLSRLLAESK